MSLSIVFSEKELKQIESLRRRHALHVCAGNYDHECLLMVFFEKLYAWAEGGTAPVLREVAVERQRQLDVLGWSLAHDDAHTDGALAVAAASFALPSICRPCSPELYRRNLVKAGALIVAEIERLDRGAGGA